MVRLKETVGGGATNRWAEFQFQYGTIKSPDRSLLEQITIEFQFQYGTIKSFPR